MNERRFDVLVVGAGPAGIAAAVRAAQSGARVGLIDDNPLPGGQIWRGGADTRLRVHGAPAAPAAKGWFDQLAAADIAILRQTKIIAAPETGCLLAEQPGDALRLRYRRLILATGARERFLPFPGWTLPGVSGAGGLQALVKGGLPIRGKRVVVAGSGPLLPAVAAYLKSKGASVRLIAEQASWARLAPFALGLIGSPGKIRQAAQLGWDLRGVPLHTSCWVSSAHGEDHLTAVTVRRRNRSQTLDCDYLACGFGLVPNSELPAACGCMLIGGAAQVNEWQQTTVPDIYCAGEVTGIGGLELALVEGQIAGLAATDRHADARKHVGERTRLRRFANALEHGFALRRELKSLPRADTIVCRCEDVPYRELERHESGRGARLHARCGMGPCQGRVCGAATTFFFGWAPDSVRPPVSVARLESLIQPNHTEESSHER